MKYFYIFFIFSSIAHASLPKPEWVSGRLGVQQFSSRLENLQTSSYAWFKLDPSLVKESDLLILRASLLGQVFYNSISEKRSFNLEGDLREGFLQINPLSGLEIRLGKIITLWGKTDAVNPTDYLSARDLTFLSEDTELRRLGGLGTEIRFTPHAGVSPFQFTGVFFGYGPRNSILLPAISATGLNVQRELGRSLVSQKNFEWALKTAYIKENWDVSISAFRGRDRFTELVFVPQKLLIEQQNPRVVSLGMDASLGLQNWILRFESAYHQSEFGSKGAENAALTQPDHLDSVFAVEKPWGDEWRVIVQGLYRYHTDWVDPSRTYTHLNPVFQNVGRGLAQQNSILKNYQRRSRPAASISIAYANIDKTWSGDFSLMGNLLGGDKVWRMKLAYKPIEDFKINAGAEIYSGSRLETFGILKDFSNLFFEGQYYF